jgi:hypothetical protein
MRCGARFDENTVSLGQGGTSGGIGVVVRLAFSNPSRQPPEGLRPLSFRLLSLFGEEDFQGGLSGTRNWDTVL